MTLKRTISSTRQITKRPEDMYPAVILVSDKMGFTFWKKGDLSGYYIQNYGIVDPPLIGC